MYATYISILVHVVIEIALIIRLMTRSHRDPASRVAWVVVILALPIVGVLAYILLGETSIGRRRIARMREVIRGMPAMADVGSGEAANAETHVPERYRHLFRVGKSITGFDAIGGNSAKLMEDSNATIDSMVAGIDAASDHVHLLFYIWLPDNNGMKMVEAHER